MKSNKTTTIVLTVIISLLCAYYLSFTFRSNGITKDAEKYATNKEGVIDEKKKQSYLDSLWDNPQKVKFSHLGQEFTYQDIKRKELALGLDLQGGISVTVEISPIEILKVLGKPKDKDFKKAINMAKDKQKSSGASFEDLFFSSFSEIAPNRKLNEIFTKASTQNKINFQTSNADVIKSIKTDIKDAVDIAFRKIRKRIDAFGVANPNIQKIPGTGRILIELPGVKNPERVRELISAQAKLEFWQVWGLQEVLPQMTGFLSLLEQEQKRIAPKIDTKDDKEAEGALVAEEEGQDGGNSLVAEEDTPQNTDTTNVEGTTAEGDSTKEEVKDTTQKEVADTSKTDKVAPTPLLAPLQGRGFVAKVADTSIINRVINSKEGRLSLSSQIHLFWDAKPMQGTEGKGDEEAIILYPIRGRKAPLEGEVITQASQVFDESSKPSVSMQMNTDGARKWRELTGQNVGKRVAVVLDNIVYSDPVIQGEIPNGSTSITGNFTLEEAVDLANVLKSGKLPTPVRIVEEAVVGPSLGQESIGSGLTSMLIGFSLVIVFMVLYYRGGGLVANLALLLNLFFIIGVLAQFGAVLTLAGMAGIVLTIGMSVDANVLIYERIREELSNDKPKHIAIDTGYRKALSSIIDANVTTFLIAVILYLFGSGSVKGFAITLMIGIACSLFSAIFITRLVIEWFRKQVSFDSLLFKGFFSNPTFNFVNMREKAYIFSGSFIAVGLILMFSVGFNLGVDFVGGRSYVVGFDEPVSAVEARSELSKQVEGSLEVKTFGGNTKLKITTNYKLDDESAEADKEVQEAVLAGLKKYKNPEILSTNKVGGTIADDIRQTSTVSILFSLALIFVYILVRFRNISYSLGALAALFHDVLIVLAVFSITTILGLSLEIDQVFIAAMLTVIGYSINDTVVVFDRMREFSDETNILDEKSFNRSINDTLSRTIMTSSTTLVVVLILVLFAGEVLRGFSSALLVGVLIGTYSSVFVASPLAFDISNFLKNRKKGNNTKSTTKVKPAVS